MSETLVDKFEKPETLPEATGLNVRTKVPVPDSEEIENLKDSSCYNNYINLKNANIKLPLTEEMKGEIKKVHKDIHYFCENYFFVTHPSEGVMLFDSFDFQKRLIDTYYNNRNTIAMLPRQSGKCVTAETVVKIRNKETKEETEITMGELYQLLKEKEDG